MFHHSVRNCCPNFIRNEIKKCPKFFASNVRLETFSISTTTLVTLTALIIVLKVFFFLFLVGENVAEGKVDIQKFVINKV